MRIVFPDGAGCVQDPADLEPLRKLGPVDFYDGVPGVGFFLAYLGAITGQERYTALARRALQAVRRKLVPEK